MTIRDYATSYVRLVDNTELMFIRDGADRSLLLRFAAGCDGRGLLFLGLGLPVCNASCVRKGSMEP